MCQPGSTDRLPKECEMMVCIPNVRCQFIHDCQDLSCCHKSEYCKKNSPNCQNIQETPCTKRCTVDGECFYDCSGGCCCPMADKDQCLADCALSGTKVCAMANPEK
jgi:hypothetical protein